jgi:hypothetical protein
MVMEMMTKGNAQDVLTGKLAQTVETFEFGQPDQCPRVLSIRKPGKTSIYRVQATGIAGDGISVAM